MATPVTVATFNTENLFTRYNFRGEKTGKDEKGKTVYRPYTAKEFERAVKDGFILDPDVFKTTLKPVRKLTGRALRGVKAHVVGLQEVESLDTLKKFNRDYLTKSTKFKYQVLIDGNDQRYIDVGLMSKLPIDFIRTHQFRKKKYTPIFARDCLEVHIKVGAKTLPIFVNHFTSMMRGRAKTRYRREGQSKEIIKILKERFGEDFGDHDFIILGDLNDYMEPDDTKSSGIRSLLLSDQMENVIDRLPEPERWTHYYKGDKSHRQLDYILLSRSLAEKNAGVLPVIERRGQPKRVNRPGEPPRVKKFFKEVTGGKKASDHCPVAITLKV